MLYPLRRPVLFLLALCAAVAAQNALANTDPRAGTEAPPLFSDRHRVSAADSEITSLGHTPFYFVLEQGGGADSAVETDWGALTIIDDASDLGLAERALPRAFPRGVNLYTTEDILALFGLLRGDGRVE